MHPSQHFDKPGKSPFMDMQLVPKYADRATPTQAAQPAEQTSRSTRALFRSLGIRLDMRKVASKAVLPREQVDTVGSVGVDEHRIEAMQVRQPGWVERLDVRAVRRCGAPRPATRGNLFAGPFATQQELLIALQSNDPTLIEAARRRLALFGLSEAQIARVEKTQQVERRVDYYAPFDGYVMELGARQGAAVEPGATLFQLANLNSVWVTAEVPETQAAWLKPVIRPKSKFRRCPGSASREKLTISIRS
jgi:Cu(I)/Ag(I) efflux system membrane fusion protein